MENVKSIYMLLFLNILEESEMKISFMNFRNFSAAMMIYIFLKLALYNACSDKSKMIASNINKMAKNDAKASENENIQVKDTNFYFICLTVDKFNFMETLTSLLKVLFLNNESTLFCRSLSGLDKIPKNRRFFRWDYIPAIIQHAYSNEKIPAKSIDNSFIKNILSGLMEFYDSSKESESKNTPLADFICGIKENINSGNVKPKCSQVYNEGSINESLQTNPYKTGQRNDEKTTKSSGIKKQNLFIDSDPSFFCISDAIISEFDYEGVGNAIKNKISNGKNHLKPKDFFEDSLKDFKSKNENSYEVLAEILFNKSGFFVDKKNIKIILKMKCKEFIENMKKIIMEKINEIDFDRQGLKPNSVYSNAYEELESLKKHEWDNFLQKYKYKKQEDADRYIFLQLRKKNYEKIPNEFCLLTSKTNYKFRQSLFYKLVIENSSNYDFYIFTVLDIDSDKKIKKYITFTEQKVQELIYRFFSSLKFEEGLNASFPLYRLAHEESSKKKYQYYPKEIEDLRYFMNQNTNITLSSYDKQKNSKDFFVLDIKCAYFSEELCLSKLSIAKDFSLNTIPHPLFEDKTFYPFSIIPILDHKYFSLDIDLYYITELNKYDFSNEMLNFNFKINFSFKSPNSKFKRMLFRVNEYKNHWTSRYNRSFIIDSDSIVKQICFYSEEKPDLNVKPIEIGSKLEIKEFDWNTTDLKPIFYTKDRTIKVLLYREEEKVIKEGCILETTIRNEIFEHELLQTIFFLFDEGYRESFRSFGYSINYGFNVYYISKYYGEVISKAKLIDQEYAKKISEILNEDIKNETKNEKLVDLIIIILVDKINNEYLKSIGQEESESSGLHRRFISRTKQLTLRYVNSKMKEPIIFGEVGAKMIVRSQFLSYDPIPDDEKLDIIRYMEKLLSCSIYIR